MRTVYRPVPWRRNLRKVPAEIRAKLAEHPETDFVVGVVKTLTNEQVEGGMFVHLGIDGSERPPTSSVRLVPEADMGRYSCKNQSGWEVVLRHEPKIYKTFTFDVPNFGDWSRGSHTVEQQRLVYQRDEIAPPRWTITGEMLVAQAGAAIYRFAVGIPLAPHSRDFENNLLFGLNLLQENLGVCDVLDREATVETLIETQLVDWEIFPPGTSAELAARVAAERMIRRSAEQEAIIFDRHRLFKALGPRNFIRGTGGMSGYIGALFGDDLVVFENVRHGNALYVLYEDWQALSQRSRIDLMRSGIRNFTRFPHRDGWKDRFIDHLRREKSTRGLDGRRF